MKFFSTDLPKLLNLIEKEQITALLLHGPNQGFITTVIELISKKLNYNIVGLSAKNLTASKLSLISNRKNFFGDKELIKITDNGTAINKELKDFFTDNSYGNFICFIADDSLPRAGIRIFFENTAHLASMACYYDNEQTIGKYILQECKKHGKQIDEETLFYLRSHLKGDNRIIKSELAKLFHYTYDKKNILKEDLINCLSTNLLASGDEMCIFFAKKDFANFLIEMDKLKSQNLNEVLIVRALIRYFINIFIVTTHIENGENIDTAIQSLSPPIFYKYIYDFKQIIKQFNSKDAIRILGNLQNEEVKFKKNSKDFNLFATLIDLS